jgi:hypothetical protein
MRGGGGGVGGAEATGWSGREKMKGGAESEGENESGRPSRRGRSKEGGE